MDSSLLRDRAIVAVSGEEAELLLNRLFTNSMLGMRGVNGARYAALLSPQGKLLHDFLVYRHCDAFWIDCRRDQAAELASKLTKFKLRAKATVADLSDELAVVATWGGILLEAPGPAFRDPRHDRLGYRIVAPPERLSFFRDNAAAYRAHQIALGVPEGGADWRYGDAFVHDANLDLLHGVDFDKGCYVGQEVVSRVHHRNSARKRIVKIHFHGDPPSQGVALMAGPLRVGQVTSLARQEGLATARIDRLEEAEAGHAPVLAGETLVSITLPSASVVAPPTYDDDDFP